MRIVPDPPVTSAPIRSDAVLRRIFIAALLGMAVVLALAGYGVYGVYSLHVARHAEGDALNIAKAILSRHTSRIVRNDAEGSSRIVVDPSDAARFDADIRGIAAPFGVVKIKIYSGDRSIVYSTDRSIVGRRDYENRQLGQALLGIASSKLESHDTVSDLFDEARMDVDLVEAYIPINDLVGRVAGSFEIYMDVSRYRRDLAWVVGASLAILTGVMLTALCFSFILVRRGANRLKEAQIELEKLAITDPLTGLLNRREIFRVLEREISRMQRSSRRGENPDPTGIIMLDLDHFKQVNDNFGHIRGDEVLRELALRISGARRAYDSIGRYGGEEFLMVLPGSTLDEAVAVAERLRCIIGDLPFVGGLRMTGSLGVSCVSFSEPDFSAALRRADDALFQAKKGGRNRTVVIPPADVQLTVA